jgi:hypothetical protein
LKDYKKYFETFAKETKEIKVTFTKGSSKREQGV